MEKYKDLSQNSGVVAFEEGLDFIKVKFRDGEVYQYDHRHPGKLHVENMKELARQGQGLSTYISQHVRENFSKKI